MRFKHTLQTTSSPDKIWQIWTDVEHWPTWDSELLEASLDQPFQVGARGRLAPRRGPQSMFEISALDPGVCYRMTAYLPLARLQVERSLSSQIGLTTFTHEAWFDGPLGLLFDRLLGKTYQSALPQAMERLRQQAERF